MASKPSDRRHRAEGGEEEPLDLDVTPFLNIMFMLILSILAMTAWTQLAMLNVQAPQIGGGASAGGQGPDAPASQLNLTVFIMKDGFDIAATGATLDGNSEGRPGQRLVPKINVTEGGKQSVQYDYAGLQRRLIEIKKSFPAEQSMIVSADADVPYEVVIKVMDAARKSADGKLLFPSVAFAAGIVG